MQIEKQNNQNYCRSTTQLEKSHWLHIQSWKACSWSSMTNTSLQKEKGCTSPYCCIRFLSCSCQPKTWLISLEWGWCFIVIWKKQRCLDLPNFVSVRTILTPQQKHAWFQKNATRLLLQKQQKSFCQLCQSKFAGLNFIKAFPQDNLNAQSACKITSIAQQNNHLHSICNRSKLESVQFMKKQKSALAFNWQASSLRGKRAATVLVPLVANCTWHNARKKEHGQS